MNSLSLTLHEVKLALESDNDDFLAYAQGHLAALLSPLLETPDIQVRLRWGQELFPAHAPLDKHRRLSRRLLLGKDEIVQTETLMLPGLQLRTSLTDGTISMDAAFRAPPKWMGLIPTLRSKTNQERIYALLIYYLVYFPLLGHMERTRHWYPLHASAVAWPRGALVLAGLGGVGKSTLTLAFLRDPEARLLSENLVLYDQERVYAFPEPIHLDARSRDLLGNLNGRLEPTGRVYSHSRQSYQVPTSARAGSARPRIFCTLCQGKELALRALSVEEALEIALSSDILTKELNEYAQQIAALNLLAPREGSYQRRIETLRHFLQGMPCYELTFRPGEDLSRVVALMREKLA